MWTSYKVTEQIRIKEMFSFFKHHYEADYDFQGEAHNFWECLYIENGSVCVSADGRIYNLKKNEIIFHKPLEFHKFYVDSENGADGIVFSFSLEGDLCDYFANKVFVLSEEQKSIISSMQNYVNKTLEKTDIPNSFHLYLEPFKLFENYSQMLTTYIYQLFLSLADSGTVLKQSHSLDAEIFHKAVDYMNSNINSQISVLEIAKICNTSQSSLKRIFGKFSGVGIHKYFTQIKIKTASELLKSGMSVKETAEKLGFSSQCYFSNVFRRETGIIPSSIKKDVKI